MFARTRGPRGLKARASARLNLARGHLSLLPGPLMSPQASQSLSKLLETASRRRWHLHRTPVFSHIYYGWDVSLTDTLCGRYYYPHFPDKATEAEAG